MSVDPRSYWERAGTVGYGGAMFGSQAVEQHVNRRLWEVALAIGWQLGLRPSSRVLDLGCGDGRFANQMLAANFASVDGVDLSAAAIRRASANAPGAHVRFAARDITQLDFDATYDGAFLIGILHHVKPATPQILRTLHRIAPRIVVLEPNGNHLLRKALELTPSYRAAGEASFRRRQLRRLFVEAGYRRLVSRRLNLFPNFTPYALFRLLKPVEAVVEATPVLRMLCTVDMHGYLASDDFSSTHARHQLPA
jgi:SAM-dependent methyltransferase